MQTKVSIIIPIYNIKDYLFECIRSVVLQTLKDVEIICVNDGSTDGSEKIVERFLKTDSRVRLINKKNGGLGAARNSGFKVARGKYIIFLDGDDFLDPRACEMVYENGEKFHSDVIFFGVWNYFSHFDYTDTFQDSELYLKASHSSPFNISDYPDLMRTHSVWSRAYSREFLEKNNLKNPEQRFAEDMLFSYKAATLAENVSIIPENLYFYRQNRSGSLLDLEKKNDTFKLCYIDTALEVRNFLNHKGVSQDLKREFLSNVFRWSPLRQDNISNFSDFRKFFQSMRKFIGKDYSLISLEHKDKNYQKKLGFYATCLKLNLPTLYFLTINLKNRI